MIGSRFAPTPYAVSAVLALFLSPNGLKGQDSAAPDPGVASSKLAIEVLQEVREENVEKALQLLGESSGLAAQVGLAMISLRLLWALRGL